MVLLRSFFVLALISVTYGRFIDDYLELYDDLIAADCPAGRATKDGEDASKLDGLELFVDSNIDTYLIIEGDAMLGSRYEVGVVTSGPNAENTQVEIDDEFGLKIRVTYGAEEEAEEGAAPMRSPALLVPLLTLLSLSFLVNGGVSKHFLFIAMLAILAVNVYGQVQEDELPEREEERKEEEIQELWEEENSEQCSDDAYSYIVVTLPQNINFDIVELGPHVEVETCVGHDVCDNKEIQGGSSEEQAEDVGLEEEEVGDVTEDNEEIQGGPSEEQEEDVGLEEEVGGVTEGINIPHIPGDFPNVEPSGAVEAAEGAEEAAGGAEEAAEGAAEAAEGAEETAAVAEETAVVAEETAVVAEETAAVAEETAVVAEETAVVPEETAAVAEETAVVAEETAVVAEETAVVAEETAAVPEETADGGAEGGAEGDAEGDVEEVVDGFAIKRGVAGSEGGNEATGRSSGVVYASVGLALAGGIGFFAAAIRYKRREYRIVQSIQT